MKCTLSPIALRADHAGPGVERGLGGDVGREARRVGLHPDRGDVDDEPRLALAHVGQQTHDQLDRAEVVELDRALEVVEAVVGERDRAADRAAGVVDEDVDRRMVGEHPLARARRPSRDRRRRPSTRTRCRPCPRSRWRGLLELVGAARDEQRDPAGPGDLERRRLADPARGAGDQHRLAVDRALEAAVLEQVGVEVALPVVPQLRRRSSRAAARRCPMPSSARSVSRVSNWAVSPM